MKYKIFTLIASLLLLTSCFKKDNELVIDDPNDVISTSSSCSATQTITNKYLEDANRLALREIMADNGNTWQDSIRIDPTVVSRTLGALISVHNGTLMIYRDTVIALFGITTRPDPILDRMLIKVDTSKSWVRQWVNTNGASLAEIKILNMMETYNLSYADYESTAIGNYVTLESNLFLNIKALAKEFKTVNGILNAQIDAEYNDETDITYSYNSTGGFRELIYSIGYKSCNVQCIKRRFYKFRVLDGDCHLEFGGAYGDPPPL